MSHVTIIAEAGVNHNGCLDRARRLIDAAADAKADVIKFQTFRTDALVTRAAPKADYQRIATSADGTQFDMLSKLELSQADHFALLDHCAAAGIEFLSTPFDMESLVFLTDSLGVRRLKIGSGDLTNAPLLLAAARSGRPIILSTGMASLSEVREALGVLAFGYLEQNPPTAEAFVQARMLPEGARALREKVTLLHCTSEYPAPLDSNNLRAMTTMWEAFELPVGLSDHSDGIDVAIAAVARDAVVIEKHLTLDRTLPGPDHSASLEPEDIARMVAAIRRVESALGSADKAPAEAERQNMSIARKSLFASRHISRGEPFTEWNVVVKRPGTGLPAIRYWELLGQPARRDFDPDDPIEL